jgi:hypothetical protein
MVIDLNAAGEPVARCSGAVVNSPNGSVVWTAAHCIFLRGQFRHPFPHIVFVPGAEPGASFFDPTAPYGVWSVIAYAMPADWVRHGGERHWREDYGALLIARDAGGATIRQAVGGAQRISFRGTDTGRSTVLGYPGQGQFRTNDALIGCGPRKVGRFPFVGGSGPEPLAIRCAMTSGASGGPWLTHVHRNGIGSVIAVTSSASNTPGFLYAPVQDRIARAVWSLLARRSVH